MFCISRKTIKKKKLIKSAQPNKSNYLSVYYVKVLLYVEKKEMAILKCYTK